MSLVIDASLTVAWYFPDEGSEATDVLLRRVARSGVVVPVHWRAEVANAFHMAVRRKRIDAACPDQSLADLACFDIATDHDSNAHMWGATVALAERHGLTVYDAAYLELARHRWRRWTRRWRGRRRRMGWRLLGWADLARRASLQRRDTSETCERKKGKAARWTFRRKALLNAPSGGSDGS